MYYTEIDSVFGNIVIMWEKIPKIKVKQILLPAHKDRFNKIVTRAIPSTTQVINELGENITRFLKGESLNFTLDIIDLDVCSEFQKRVVLAEYGIPRGYVSTYGWIAKHIGSPNASRAVGRVLATNPFPLVIPCHRAVRSNGELGGYQGGVEMKRRLLKMEGINFSSTGRVQMKNMFY